MTGLQALRAAEARLAAAGVPDATGDAQALLDHAFGRISPVYRDPGAFSAPLPPEVAQRFEGAIAARLMRQPVSQIRGWRYFWKHRFLVTPDVLDPRPDTETLVAAALDEPFGRVLDLGTGSGAILLSLLAERPAATGVGIDLSPAALAVAGANAASLGLQDRVTFAQSDWFAAVTGRYDLIVANPPYIAAAEMAELAPEVRDHEPHLALTPGGDGLDAYRAIAASVTGYLAPRGRVLVEIGPRQADAVRTLLSAAGLSDIRIVQDLDGRDRVVAARGP